MLQPSKSSFREAKLGPHLSEFCNQIHFLRDGFQLQIWEQKKKKQQNKRSSPTPQTLQSAKKLAIHTTKDKNGQCIA